jgi:serine/threonine protein kinase
MQVPTQWPAEVAKTYEPIRVLGKGGFASVVLARKKVNNKTDGKEESLAAIKVVGSQNYTRADWGYAHREMDILAELSHPNIMRVLEHWDNNNTNGTKVCAAVMALSYAPGPTVQALLLYGGRLSFGFARVVTAQLVDAVAYLHSHAVIHRDVKPDNLVVTGASFDQNEIWDDDAVPSKQQGSSTSIDWNGRVKKWHVTLVDFGFARALTPDDMKKKSPKFADSEQKSDLNSSGHSKSSLDRSASFLFTRTMSSLGHRAFVAPEIIKGVQKWDKNYPSGDDSSHTGLSQPDITKTLSGHVSYYGMMVDAFSVGSTMKYFLTGVPPDQDVNQIIDLQNNPILVLGRLLCGGKKEGKHGEKQRRVQYRRMGKIPPEVWKLIQGLTNYDSQKRTSIRMARRYPYVNDILESEPPPLREEITFLNIVLKTAQRSSIETVSQ